MRLAWDVCHQPPEWPDCTVTTGDHHIWVPWWYHHSVGKGTGAPVQVDPHLSRTVVVSTKLDTRLPQFARGHDVELFLRPSGRLLEPGMLGGCPFFT